MTNLGQFHMLALLLALSASLALAARRSSSNPASADALDTGLEHRKLTARYVSTRLLPTNGFNCTLCYDCLTKTAAAAPSKSNCGLPCLTCLDKQEIMALSEISLRIYNGTAGIKAFSITPSGIEFQVPLVSSGPFTSSGT
jgi:hypothetical protein